MFDISITESSKSLFHHTQTAHLILTTLIFLVIMDVQKFSRFHFLTYLHNCSCMKNTNCGKCVWYKTLKVKSKHLQPLTGNSDKFLFVLQPIICQNKAVESSDGMSNSNSLVTSRRRRLGCDITCQTCRENSRSPTHSRSANWPGDEAAVANVVLWLSTYIRPFTYLVR